MHSEVKKQQIDDFVSYTCTSKQIAERFLTNAKWNMQQAMNSFYDQGAPMPQPQIPAQIKEVQNFFNSNSVNEDQKLKIINQDGLEKLFKEILKVDTSNIVIGHIMINVMGMKKAGEATKENIYNLFKYTNSKSFIQVSKNIGKLQKQIKHRKDLFRNMYINFFEFYSVTKVPTLDFQTAVQIWETYLKDIMPYYEYFVEYLKTLEKKPFKVHKDLWKMTYQFATLFKSVSQYSENDGWPLMIDDFVTFLRQKNIK